jgi:membrane-associated phospholipid phosphatase
MKNFFLVCGFACIACYSYAQSAFSLGLKDIAIGSIAAGAFISPFLFHNTPEAAPQFLNRDDVNAFDRNLMFTYNKPLDLVSDYGVALLAVPVLSLALNIKDESALLTYSVMYGEALLLTNGTFNLIKSAVIRYRPYMYSGEIPQGKEQDYYNSFPSGAAANAFLSAAFLTAAFSKEYPDSPWKLPVAGASYALAAAFSAARVLSGAHFLSDALAGAAIGSLYGYCIPYLHLNNRNKNSAMAFYPAQNGFTLSFRF